MQHEDPWDKYERDVGTNNKGVCIQSECKKNLLLKYNAIRKWWVAGAADILMIAIFEGMVRLRKDDVNVFDKCVIVMLLCSYLMLLESVVF